MLENRARCARTERVSHGWFATRIGVAVTVYLVITPAARAADIGQAVSLYKSGKYDECIQYAAKGIEEKEYSETWHLVKIRAELALGQYAEALATLDDGLGRFANSVRLRWIGHEVCLYNNEAERATRLLVEIEHLAQVAPWRYSDPENRIVLGRFLLRRGVDPKQVLESLYDKVKKDAPNYAEAYIASGQLALEKHDYALAAEAFNRAVDLDPTNPDVHFGVAQAYAPSDEKKSQQALETALQRNPNHIDCLLVSVEDHIDAERYGDAEQLLERILKINDRHPHAWAYRAVLAHLNSEAEQEIKFRDKALSTWQSNPQVDHLIGRKLSQKYRFAEGAACQRRSLAFDAQYLPAKIQLAQDLLRLGNEQEGWQLADDVYQRDGYNVVAHNLVTLQENLRKYRTLEGDGFVVRMEAREAEIYGHHVLQLLRSAQEQLCAKYEVELPEPIYVEIFHQQQDFAIRTFGLPGGAGFLGVCFGRVITMNSPASQGASPSNWQSVVWHEFCHVVTLNKTNNKMPRWLSEGISVYEERQANPAWGQTMEPRYREMILGEDLTPVSGLSGAFLHPKSPLHLQFAYYESSLVVEYVVEKYGLEILKRILVDLGVGMSINDALRRYAGSLEELDHEFAQFARGRAEQLAPKLTWEQIDLPPTADSATLAPWKEEHPHNFFLLQRLAMRLVAEEQWQAAKEPLQELLAHYPEYCGDENAYEMLARVHRQLGETTEERAVLERLAVLDADAVEVYLRLMEITALAQDWPATMKYAAFMLAVNPLQRAPHRFLAEAAQETGDDAQAIEAIQVLLLMDPIDPADTHYRLAKLLRRAGDLSAARRHTLQALEEAPRFRDAHRQLLEIIQQMGENGENDDSHKPVPTTAEAKP